MWQNCMGIFSAWKLEDFTLVFKLLHSLNKFKKILVIDPSLTYFFVFLSCYFIVRTFKRSS